MKADVGCHIDIRGKVISISRSEAQIEIFPPQACSGCGSCAHSKKRKMKIPIEKGMNEGSGLILRIDCRKLNGMFFIAYFIPAFFLIAGFLPGYALLGNAGGFLGAIMFAAGGSFISGRLSRRRYKEAVKVKTETDEQADS
ncbi:MAG: SoxR reducing system RseC family protein [Elusimicrobiota bacterium]